MYRNKRRERVKPLKRPRAVIAPAAPAVTATALTAAEAPAHQADAAITVDLDDAPPISDRLYGLSYEDINHATG